MNTEHRKETLRGGTRRSFLRRLGGTALAGCAAGLAGPSGRVKAGEPHDDPPFFETARHQFTLIEPRKPPSAAAFHHLDGRPANLSDWHGKVILLNFWASWCPQCRTELPVLDGLQVSLDPARYQVLAISTDHTGKTAVDPYLKSLSLKHLALGLDPEGALGRPMPSGGAPDPNPPPFVIFGMPMSYLIDPAGRVCGYMIGAADWASPDARALLNYYATS
jgi:thiol-disulfide isomerase/thioredoxin